MYMIILIGLGAGAGWLAHRHMDLPMSQTMAVAAGALGALLGGMALQAVFSLLAAVIGAVLGAALLIWATSEFQKRR